MTSAAGTVDFSRFRIVVGWHAIVGKVFQQRSVSASAAQTCDRRETAKRQRKLLILPADKHADSLSEQVIGCLAAQTWCTSLDAANPLEGRATFSVSVSFRKVSVRSATVSACILYTLRFVSAAFFQALWRIFNRPAWLDKHRNVHIKQTILQAIESWKLVEMGDECIIVCVQWYLWCKQHAKAIWSTRARGLAIEFKRQIKNKQTKKRDVTVSLNTTRNPTRDLIWNPFTYSMQW